VVELEAAITPGAAATSVLDLSFVWTMASSLESAPLLVGVVSAPSGWTRNPAAGFCALAASGISTRPDDAPEPVREVAAERAKEAAGSTSVASAARAAEAPTGGRQRTRHRSSRSRLGCTTVPERPQLVLVAERPAIGKTTVARRPTALLREAAFHSRASSPRSCANAAAASASPSRRSTAHAGSNGYRHEPLRCCSHYP
jgi:hypothetical protein